jgi:glycosyltransferase involved in cell wall biosynthesis
MITILTPTYNREKTLPRLFASLMEQTSYQFEWLIIDDGSSDNSEALIIDYQQIAPFEIRYIKKENGGKHTALNLGFKEAKKEWIFVVDSDDWLDKSCIDFIVNKIEKQTLNVGGISFLRCYQDGEVIGEPYKLGLNNYLERAELKVKGDKADIFRKSHLEGFEFPEFPNENFMAESPLFLWYGAKWKTSFYNYPGYICEYQVDGLSANSIKNRHRCHRSTSYVYECQWNMFSKFLPRSRAAINWWRFNKVSESSSGWRPPVVFYFLGLLLRIKDKLIQAY